MDTCPACLREPPPFAAAYAPLRYADPADWLIRRLKFHRRLDHGRALAGLMADHLRALEAVRPDALIPMPLHRRRWRERGYNQAAELAHPLGRHLGVPVWPDAARRPRPTVPQANLPAARRRANVRGAFAADRRVAQRHVAIVDDVAATTHTAAELARCLLRAGAARVDLYCAARA